MRRWTQALVGSLGGIAFFFLAADGLRIAPLLPQRNGASCFTADYATPREVELILAGRRTPAAVKSLKVKLTLPPSEVPFRSGKRKSIALDRNALAL